MKICKGEAGTVRLFRHTHRSLARISSPNKKKSPLIREGIYDQLEPSAAAVAAGAAAAISAASTAGPIAPRASAPRPRRRGPRRVPRGHDRPLGVRRRAVPPRLVYGRGLVAALLPASSLPARPA